MASIHREILIDAPPALVWDALRDWAVPHQRLVPGFVTAAHLDGRDRVVTFFNGLEAKELLVDLDEDARRLAWSAVGGSLSHHNAVAQVFADGDGTRFVWIADLLPDEAAPYIASMIERGIGVIKETLEGAARSPGDTQCHGRGPSV